MPLTHINFDDIAHTVLLSAVTYYTIYTHINKLRSKIIKITHILSADSRLKVVYKSISWIQCRLTL